MSQALIALINLSAVYAFPRGAWERVRKFPSAEGCQAKPDGVVDENLLGIPTQEHGNEYKHRHSHAGAWERVKPVMHFLVPTLPRGNLLCSLPHGNTSLKF